MLDKIERITGKITISIILSVLLFSVIDILLAELYLEKKLSHYNKSKTQRETYFMPAPYSMFTGNTSREWQNNTDLNEWGFRGPVPEMPKPVNEYRIAVLGGSTVLVGNPTLSEIIQDNFAKDNLKNIRVYNFGVLASVLRMDIARLLFSLNKINADLIIFYGGGNNIVMPFQADPRPGYPPNFLVNESNPLLTAGTSKQSIFRDLSPLLFKSKLISATVGDSLREYVSNLAELRAKTGWSTPEWTKKVAESYLSDLQLAEKVSSSLGSKSLFVFQPLLFYKKHIADSESLYFNQPELREHVLLSRSIIDQKISSSRPVQNFLDLSDIYNDEEKAVFTDGIHLYQEHYSKVSDRIYHHLIEILPELSNLP